MKKLFASPYLSLLFYFILVNNLSAQINSTAAYNTGDHDKEIIAYFTQWDAWKAANAGLPAQGVFNQLNADYSQYTVLSWSFLGVAQDGSMHSGDLRNKQIHQFGTTQATGPMFWDDIYSSWDYWLLFGELQIINYLPDNLDQQPNHALYWAYQNHSYKGNGSGWINTKTNETGSYPLPLAKPNGAKGLMDLCKENGVKVTASIGGWSMSKHFPEMAADPVKRKRFVDDCVRLIDMGFDGIDIDWEYANNAGMNIENYSYADFANFAILMEDMRAAIGPDKLITAAFSASPSNLSGFDWPRLCNSMDYFNMMSYDYEGGWSNNAGHNSALYGSLSWDNTAEYMKSVGVPASKINMGIAFYGRGVETNSTATLGGSTKKQARTVQPDGPAYTAADFTNWPAFDGTPSHYYIKNEIDNSANGWTKKWDDVGKVPYATKGNYFLSYDNEQSIGLKADYIKDKGLAGVIIWQTFGDWEVGSVSQTFGNKLPYCPNAKAPLVNKLNEVFAGGVTNPAQDQTITFDALLDKLTTSAPFTATATASSGLPVSLTIVSGPATINGNTITLTKEAGTVVARASQAGNTSYNAALNVDQSFEVLQDNTETKQQQSITFPPIPDKLTTDAAFSIFAAASSGLPVAFSVAAGPATISGNTITLNGTEGTVIISASQAGNASYYAAANVESSFAVNASNGGGDGGEIDCDNLSNKRMVDRLLDNSTAFQAKMEVLVQGNVTLEPSNQMMMFEAGESVIFGPGFSAMAGSNLTAQIKECEDTGGENPCNIPAWDAAKTYAIPGNKVGHNNKKWRNKWWTKGEEPGTTGQYGVWEETGTCESNGKPSVAITSPTDGAILTVEEMVNLVATASDAEGAVSTVKFNIDGQILTGAKNADGSWSVNWIPTTAGTFNIQATATDDEGNTTDHTISVTVQTASTNNEAPMISITAPTSGVTVNLGTFINIAATATDADGSIAGVSFKVNNQTLNGVLNNGTYGATWNPSTTGTFNITATATDNEGAMSSTMVSLTIAGGDNSCDASPWDINETYATPGNEVAHNGQKWRNKWWTKGEEPGTTGQYGVWEDLGECVSNGNPNVAITNPTNNTTINNGTMVTLTATATDAEGTVTGLTFSINNQNIPATNSAGNTWTADWTPTTNGNFTLTATATDNENNTADNSINLTVQDANSSNVAPVVSFISPTDGNSMDLGNGVTIEASASDADGSIATVVYAVDNQTLNGSGIGGTYQAVWNPSSAGVFTITATATDNQGAVSSATISVTIVDGNGGGSGSDLNLANLPLQIKFNEGITATYTFDAPITQVLSRNLNVVNIAVNGNQVTFTGITAGRTGLKITANGTDYFMGLRVNNADGSVPRMPKYLSVGSVSEDSQPDLNFWKDIHPGQKNKSMDIRYIYINGGPIQGWQSWGPNRPEKFARESLRHGLIPFFIYYNIPDGGESYTTNLEHVRSVEYMNAYYADLNNFLDKVHSVLQDEFYGIILEPDFLGYMQQNAVPNDPETISTVVNANTIAPDAGNVRTLVERINSTIDARRSQGHNLIYGWQLNLWAYNVQGAAQGVLRITDQLGHDAGRATIKDAAEQTALYAIRSGCMSNSADFLSIDKYGLDAMAVSSSADPAAATWFFNNDHWNNYLYYAENLFRTSGYPVILWQLPVGHINNSQYTSAYTGLQYNPLPNTHTKWEDSSTSFFLGDTFDAFDSQRESYFSQNNYGDFKLSKSGSQVTYDNHMEEVKNSGVISVLFGAGVGASTDGIGDAPTDDYFWIQKVQDYYINGPIPLDMTLFNNCSGSCPPKVSISVPEDGGEVVITNLAPIDIDLIAWDLDGQLNSLEIKINGQTTSLGTTGYIHSTTWTPSSFGNYQIIAKAIDNDMLSTSDTINFKVSEFDPVTCGVALWDAAQVYATPNTEVSWNGSVYKNKWWTQNNEPGTGVPANNPWEYVRQCTSGNLNQPIPATSRNAIPSAISDEIVMNVFPNPSKGDVQIALGLPVTTETQLFLFDEMGRTIKTLPKQQIEKGQYVVTLSKDNLQKGLYFIKLIAGDKVITKRIVRALE